MNIIKNTKFQLAMLLFGGMLAFTACGDDDEVLDLSINSVTATGTDITTANEITKDLNTAS